MNRTTGATQNPQSQLTERYAEALQQYRAAEEVLLRACIPYVETMRPKPAEGLHPEWQTHDVALDAELGTVTLRGYWVYYDQWEVPMVTIQVPVDRLAAPDPGTMPDPDDAG